MPILPIITLPNPVSALGSLLGIQQFTPSSNFVKLSGPLPWFPIDSTQSILDGTFVTSSFFKLLTPRGELWDKLIPYRLLVIDTRKNNQVVGGGTPSVVQVEPLGNGISFAAQTNRWEFFLPITPQQLSITDAYSINTSATLRGVLEEHSGVRFKNINIQGTFGVWPNRASIVDPPTTPNLLQSVFGGTIASAQNVATQFTSIINNVRTGSNAAKPKTKRPEDRSQEDKGLGTGYYQTLLLTQFLEQYAEAKRDPVNAGWRLVFDIPKQNQSFVVTPVGFTWNENVNRPMEINYSLQFKAWRRIELLNVLALNELKVTPLSPGALQGLLNTIQAAQNTAAASVNLIGAVRSDVDNVLNVIRQTGLLVKGLAGVPISMADLPAQLVIDTKSACDKFFSKLSLNSLFGQAKTNLSALEVLAGFHEKDRINEGASLSIAPPPPNKAADEKASKAAAFAISNKQASLLTNLANAAPPTVFLAAQELAAALVIALSKLTLTPATSTTDTLLKVQVAMKTLSPITTEGLLKIQVKTRTLSSILATVLQLSLVPPSKPFKEVQESVTKLTLTLSALVKLTIDPSATGSMMLVLIMSAQSQAAAIVVTLKALAATAPVSASSADSSSAASESTKSAAKAVAADSTNPANNIFEKPLENPLLFGQVPLSSLTLNSAQQKALQKELDRVNSFTVANLKEMREMILTLTTQLSNSFGAGNAYYSKMFNKPAPFVRTEPITLDEYAILQSFYDLVQSYDILTATNQFDNGQILNSMEYVSALAATSDIEFSIPNSKIQVPVPFGLNMEQIAMRYLGDPQRWIEVATLNQLREPYLDENGFRYSLLSNADGRNIVLGNSMDLFIGQTVYLNSSTQISTARTITNIVTLSQTSFLLTLSGLANLDVFTIADQAYIQAYLPGTVNSQNIIWMPSDIQAPADDQISIPSSVAGVKLVGLSKIDWLLDDYGDLAVTNTGDFRLAAGYTNLVQALAIKFGTTRGTSLLNPDFGLGVRVGIMNSDVNAKDLYNQIVGMITADPRFQGVSGLQVTLNGPSLGINLGIQIAGQSGIFPVSFQLPTSA